MRRPAPPGGTGGMRPPFLAALAVPLIIAACDNGEPEPVPAASADEAQALEQAAEMLDEQRGAGPEGMTAGQSPSPTTSTKS